MSFVSIQLTREGTEPGIDHVTAEQEAAIYKGVSQVLFDVLKKPPEWTWVAAIYKGVSQVLFDVLKKPPEWTWVVFQEVEMENWGWGGMPVAEYRKRLQAGKADNERRS